MVYFCRKLFLSLEFLLLLIWRLFLTNYQSNFFNKIDNVILSNNFSIISGIIGIICTLVWLLFFPPHDKTNAIKNFKYKNKIYITNIVSIIYAIIFNILFICSFFHTNANSIFGERYLTVALVGNLILILSMSINILIVNIYLRDGA